jgi:superfamily II DNA or RNA helicase
MTLAADEPAGLRDLDLRLGYDTADEALHDFYVPVLSRAVRYDRSVGFFRASALSVAARGMARFIAGGGTARFLIGAEILEAERDALIGATEIPLELAERLASGLVVDEDEIARRRLEVLAWLVQEERLEIRVAVAVDEHGAPVASGAAVPYFHEKIGILRDHRGDGVAFQGSVNESATGWAANFESFSVYRSWDASAAYFDQWATKFEVRWSGDVEGFKVFPLPDAVHRRLVELAPAVEPDFRDPAEAPPPAAAAALAQFLLAAPRLAGGQQLGEATSGVIPFPHQRKVVERLAGEYPRSWLVADEVGLGKTISAGLALRRLLLRGDAARVLVLAPANVCRQWQDELFEKMGLWVPRLDGHQYHGAHPDDVSAVPAGANPYVEPPVLLVSSHLARRVTHQDWILDAPAYDLMIVDEAHHARRRGADLDEYRPSRLLQLLDRVRFVQHARALWLLTATPLQVAPIELWDLLGHVGLASTFARYSAFTRFYEELAKPDADVNWRVLHDLVTDSMPTIGDKADEAFAVQLRARVGLVDTDRILRFGRRAEDPEAIVEALTTAGREELRAWIRWRGPVGQCVTRHTRATLRRYRDEGLLTEPIADRDVRAVPVPFVEDERQLYDGLDDLLDRLMRAHGTRRGVGFVLTVYRRRLTSSWEAIRRTLRRRLNRDGLQLDLDWLDETDDDELDPDAVDDAAVLPLSPRDVTEIESYLDALDRVPDSKFDRLKRDLDQARGRGQPVIVFTQFTDTLDDLRDKLFPAYRSHLATYSGEGGRLWLEDEGWVGVSKQDLVHALESGRVSVILATDAASEGLNLQVASYLINYDLPWNPMRVEQRIGRIDRIGQRAPVVTVRNYVVPGTVEEAVYAALAARIDIFAGVVGRLQPILGATEEAFRAIFRAPKSERAEVEQAAIADLLTRAKELEASGIDLSDEDPMPLPDDDPPATLTALADCLDRLDVELDRPGRPVTFDADRASRDPERWTALGTYGHPELQHALERIAGGNADGPLAVVEVGRRAVAYRADRTPPERVRHLSDLGDLGPALALGDAERLAQADARDAAEEDRRQLEQLAGAQHSQWVQQVRLRFKGIVRQAINAEQVMRRNAGDEIPDANLVWLELTNDTRTAWARADDFRQHLDMTIAELLPLPPGVDDRADGQLAAVRAQTAKELRALIEEWKRVVYPDYAAS